MAFSHGKAAVFKLDNAAGTLTDVSGYLTDVSQSRSTDTAETQTLGDASKEYLAGLKDATFSLEGKWDPALDVILDAALGASSTKTFEYGPAGTASGAIKYVGECICTSYEVSTGIDGAAEFSAELQVTGDVTRGTWA